MKKFDLKSIALGFIIGTVGITTVFAASGIKTATFSSSKVYFYGEEIPLNNQLVAIVKDGETNAQLYMPVRELLEYMNFNVDWNSADSSINLTMKGNNGNYNYNGGYDMPDDSITQNEADTKTLDIIQRTGNWSYIEPYLSYMSDDGINKVIEIYNSKHMNPAEHKKASDYVNKK